MIIEANMFIGGSREAVWSAISNIENWADSISGIESVEILERPPAGFVGLKWRETRTLFGKTATEDMWVTDAVENEFFQTRAENHGCIYISTRRISEAESGVRLTMSHETRPQGFLTKLVSIPMGFVFKGMMKKLLLQDLTDIKNAVEKGEQGNQKR